EELVLFDEPDVGAMLAHAERDGRLGSELGTAVPLAEAELAPVVVQPAKVVCVGLNYREHILETGRELPLFPTLFAKWSDCLIGPADELMLPTDSTFADWEAELAVVVGRTVHRATEEEARGAIAGFTVSNDVTMRDWQRRTLQWLQGKAFYRSTPLGPMLVTGDEVGHGHDLAVTCHVNGDLVQAARTSSLVFDPVALVAYASRIGPLRPGDVILTGTPGGVGERMSPPRHLQPDEVLVTEIEGLGRCENRCTVTSAVPSTGVGGGVPTSVADQQPA
ncbi:MAG: fumarylacetoacetate hydrolase family protein, partial [Acidimicrobiales bacterium]